MNEAQVIYQSYPGADSINISRVAGCGDIESLYEKCRQHESGDPLFDFLVIEYVEGGEVVFDNNGEPDTKIDPDQGIHALERARDDLQAVIDALSEAHEREAA